MSIKINTTDINKIINGSTQINRIYLDGTVVYGSPYTPIPQPTGQIEYTTPGTYSFVAPVGCTSVCVVAVGGGASGYGPLIFGGAGAGLGYKNDIPVIAGNSYTVVVGDYGTIASPSVGGDSYFIDSSTVKGGGASGLSSGSYVGDGGGAGGNGSGIGVGGGAGGYSGNGGNALGTYTAPGNSGTGGAGGSGARTSTSSTVAGGAGGGVGIYGQGASGAGGGTSNGGGYGGSGGTNGGRGGDVAVYTPNGGVYGAGGGAGGSTSFIGGSGAVRIIYGDGRAFPSTNTIDQ